MMTRPACSPMRYTLVQAFLCMACLLCRQAGAQDTTATASSAGVNALVCPDTNTTAAMTTIENMVPFGGNPNLLASGIPAIPTSVRARVAQYLNSRSANLEDATCDGRSILISTRFASTQQLHVVEQPMGARFQLTFGTEPVGRALFHPGDCRYVYFLQDEAGHESHQVLRLDRKTGRVTCLTDGRSKHADLCLDRAGTQLAFSNNSRNGRDTDVCLMRIDSESTAIRRLTQDAGMCIPAGFSSDGTRLLIVQYRAITDSDLHELNLVTGQMTQLTPSDKTASIRRAAYSLDGRSVYVVTDRYSDFNGLYLLNTGDLAGAPHPLTRDLPWDVDDVVLSPDGRQLLVSVNEDGLSGLYVIDTTTWKRRAVDVPARGVVRSLKFPSGRSDMAFVVVDSYESPSDVYSVNLGGGKLTRWTCSEAGGLDTSTFVAPRLVRYPSTNDLQIPAFYYPVAGGGRSPVLVIWHGGPESQSRPHYSAFVQYMNIELGTAVLMPNVRGSSGYGKRYLERDDGIRREESLADIGATLDWIASQPDLDRTRVGMFGISYGGYMCLSALTRYPDRVRAGVDVVGVSSIPAFLRNTQDSRRDLRRAEYGDERVPAVRAVLERISPLNHVDRIRVPLLVQQGKNDPRVPQSEAEQIVRSMREKGQNCWYLLGLNEGHGFGRKENSDDALVATVVFLKRHLLDAVTDVGTGTGAVRRE